MNRSTRSGVFELEPVLARARLRPALGVWVDMDSYAFQDLPPKRIKKYAARLTDDDVRASLREDDDNLPFLLEQDGILTVMFWNAFCGPMVCMDDDSVRAFAQLEFLRRNGYPRFKSYDEIEAYALSHNWPRKSRDSIP